MHGSRIRSAITSASLSPESSNCHFPSPWQVTERMVGAEKLAASSNPFSLILASSDAANSSFVSASIRPSFGVTRNFCSASSSSSSTASICQHWLSFDSQKSSSRLKWSFPAQSVSRSSGKSGGEREMELGPQSPWTTVRQALASSSIASSS